MTITKVVRAASDRKKMKCGGHSGAIYANWINDVDDKTRDTVASWSWRESQHTKLCWTPLSSYMHSYTLRLQTTTLDVTMLICNKVCRNTFRLARYKKSYKVNIQSNKQLIPDFLSYFWKTSVNLLRITTDHNLSATSQISLILFLAFIFLLFCFNV